MELAAVLLLLATVLLLPAFFLFALFAWQHVNTRGLNYFGRTSAERRAFRNQLSKLSWLLGPVLAAMGSKLRAPNAFTYERDGLHVPSNSCNAKSFGDALAYEGKGNDVFVVTQMKCGTTWMQQIVFEVLNRGEGDLSDTGHRHLNAMSPWLESFVGVPVIDAPTVGEPAHRIIKTHLPFTVLPVSSAAKYIYVTRHPVSCFRSCADFFAAVAGPFAPSRDALTDWFCSDEMWWGSWPAHVASGWDAHLAHDNVLFVRFEELKADFDASVGRVAAFLGVTLSDDELARVREKCSFEYMSAEQELFQMVPPSFFASGETFFKRGTGGGEEDVTDERADRIRAFCRRSLSDRNYPVDDHYPDINETR